MMERLFRDFLVFILVSWAILFSINMMERLFRDLYLFWFGKTNIDSSPYRWGGYFETVRPIFPNKSS